jgi:hypothetical protein
MVGRQGGREDRDVAQWQSSCLTCAKALGSTPATQKEKKRKKKVYRCSKE